MEEDDATIEDMKLKPQNPRNLRKNFRSLAQSSELKTPRPPPLPDLKANASIVCQCARAYVAKSAEQVKEENKEAPQLNPQGTAGRPHFSNSTSAGNQLDSLGEISRSLTQLSNESGDAAPKRFNG